MNTKYDNGVNDTIKSAHDTKAAYYKACFSTPDGVKVLEDLKRLTVDRILWVPGQDPSAAYFGEGQNNLYRTIVNLSQGKNNV